jgi:nucleoid-associated protein YgaU
MAKKSSIEKNARRAKMAKAIAPRRARLKALARDREAAPEARSAAAQQLGDSHPQPLPAVREAARLLSQVRVVAHRGARSGLVRADPGHGQVELVRREPL